MIKSRKYYTTPLCRRKKSNQQLVPIGKGQHIKVGSSKIEGEWIDKLGVKIRSYVIYGFSKTMNKRQIYVVDGYDPKNKICFEMNGNRYHGGVGYPHHKVDPTMKVTYGELYRKTLERYYVLHSLGYKIFRVWESDYKKGRIGLFWNPGDPV